MGVPVRGSSRDLSKRIFKTRARKFLTVEVVELRNVIC